MSYAQVYLEIVASIEFLTLENASSRSNQVIDQVIVPEDLGSIMTTVTQPVTSDRLRSVTRRAYRSGVARPGAAGTLTN